MRRQLALLLSAALASNACAMIPRYERPKPPVPEAFPAPAAAEAPAGGRPAAELRWQDFFADPHLRSVIELALANNRDLRVANLNVEKVQALYRIQRGNVFPSIGVQAAGEKVRIPDNMDDDGDGKTSGSFSVYVGTAAWEIDLFGRLRSLKASALEQYLATQHASRAAQMSLVAAVASSYLALAANAENLALARATLESQLSSHEMQKRSRDLGVASDLELRQVESQVEAARAAVAAFTGEVARARNDLDVLAGVPVPAELLPESLGAVADPAALAPGLPSDVLLARPDILAAEHRLRAANASIGAARAAFFPRISLTAGPIGTMSSDLDGLFASGSRSWLFVPQILSPIFSSGSLRANLRASQLDRDIAVAQYEKAIQVAFAETSSGLVLRQTLVEQRQAQAALVESLAETLRLSEQRYQAGLDGYLSVLVAQRALFAAQQALVGVRLAEQVNLVTLYKVLGGGV